MTSRDRQSNVSPAAVATATVAVFLALATLALAVGAAPQEDPEFTSSPIYEWLQANGSLAYVAAPLLMVVVAILPIPAEIPAAMNGMLFGPVLGIVVTWSGAMIGAVLSYELARYFGRGLSDRFVKPETLAKLEHLKDTEAAVLLVLRLTPVVAFTVVNWASGLLQVRRSTFVWTTAVGILPGTIAFTASGSLMGALYEQYPGTVAAVVVALCAALILRVWWKQRAVPSL